MMRSFILFFSLLWILTIFFPSTSIAGQVNSALETAPSITELAISSSRPIKPKKKKKKKKKKGRKKKVKVKKTPKERVAKEKEAKEPKVRKAKKGFWIFGKEPLTIVGLALTVGGIFFWPLVPFGVLLILYGFMRAKANPDEFPEKRFYKFSLILAILVPVYAFLVNLILHGSVEA
ncbi:MAG: hypothetical protein AAFY71_15870 [Bacteroidota bacterium]